MIKYIGSKRLLVPTIVRIVKSLSSVKQVIDLFSGTSRVGHALKREGHFVTANDHNKYAYTLAKCYVEVDREKVEKPVRLLLEELAALRPVPGYFTKTFCEESRFFHPKNGARVDAIREAIAKKSLDPDVEAVVLVSLMEAADRVDSTTGLQMAYLKDWAPRAHNDIELRMPEVLNGPGKATMMDAVEAAGKLTGDLAYLDPPYNQHSYLGNYHIWETLIKWDKPEAYGVARKRMDCRKNKSPFNSKKTIHAVMKKVIDALDVRYLLVSFNNEGYIAKEEMEEMLSSRGVVKTVEVDYKRYVGAQIGIYNPQGEKVGKVSHLRNKEYLYLVAPDQKLLTEASVSMRSDTSQLKLF
jgi:adenine-specific DNA-methyltransferase